MHEVFRVQFVSGLTEKTKNKYLHTIKNEWEYSSVSNFLNVITKCMVDGNIIILKIDKEIIDRLLKAVKKKNFSKIDEWFKSRIREELNE